MLVTPEATIASTVDRSAPLSGIWVCDQPTLSGSDLFYHPLPGRRHSRSRSSARTPVSACRFRQDLRREDDDPGVCSIWTGYQTGSSPADPYPLLPGGRVRRVHSRGAQSRSIRVAPTVNRTALLLPRIVSIVICSVAGCVVNLHTFRGFQGAPGQLLAWNAILRVRK